MDRATLPSQRSPLEDLEYWDAELRDGVPAAGVGPSRPIARVLPSGPFPTSVRLPHWKAAYRRRVAVADLIAVTTATFLALLIWFGSPVAVASPSLGNVPYVVIAAGLTVFWVISLAVAGVWSPSCLGPGLGEFRKIFNALVIMVGALSVGSYALKAELSRGYLAVTLSLGLLALLVGRFICRLGLARRRRLGTATSNVLVIGGAAEAADLAHHLERSTDTGYRVTGICLPALDSDTSGVAEEQRPAKGASSPARIGTDHLDHIPVLGRFGGSEDIIPAAIEVAKAQVVAVAAGDSFSPAATRRLAWQLEGTGIELVLAPTLSDAGGPRIYVKPVAGLPLLHVDEPQFQKLKVRTKNAIDFTGAVIGLIVLSPLFLVVGLTIRTTGSGPVFFRQDRVGKDGKIFRIWKFRTMEVGAQARHARNRRRHKDSSVFYKTSGPDEVTRIGRVLRRTSIDELPQLINVVFGQMSLVGPRPLVPGEAAGIPDYLERRARVRPGLTGLWQISGRSDVSAQVRVQLDLYYVSNWTLQGDFAIIARTAASVLLRKGAY